MNGKRLSILLIAGILMFCSGNAIATQDNMEDTLDIEKVAIKSMNNSISIKTSIKQRENVQNIYENAKAAAQVAVHYGMGNLLKVIIYNPITAENLLNQFITNEEVNTNLVIVDAYSKYIGLLKVNYSVNIQKALNDSLKKINAEAQLQLKNGLISKKDARLIEINYLKSNYQLESFKKNLDSAYMDINLAMGEDISKQYARLIDYNIVVEEKIKTLDKYIEAALKNRGEIVNAQSTLEAQKNEFEYDKAFFHNDYEFYIKKTQYEIDRAENDLEEVKVSIQLEITKGYSILEGYIKTLESQRINYDLAKANYESAKIQYNNGMITLNKLQEVEIAKANAQINLKNAELDAWLEQVKMNNATGIGPGLK